MTLSRWQNISEQKTCCQLKPTANCYLLKHKYKIQLKTCIHAFPWHLSTTGVDQVKVTRSSPSQWFDQKIHHGSDRLTTIITNPSQLSELAGQSFHLLCQNLNLQTILQNQREILIWRDC